MTTDLYIPDTETMDSIVRAELFKLGLDPEVGVSSREFEGMTTIMIKIFECLGETDKAQAIASGDLPIPDGNRSGIPFVKYYHLYALVSDILAGTNDIFVVGSDNPDGVSYRGQGIARKLLEAKEQAARELGIGVLEAWNVQKGEEMDARPFWEHMGYSPNRDYGGEYTKLLELY